VPVCWKLRQQDSLVKKLSRKNVNDRSLPWARMAIWAGDYFPIQLSQSEPARTAADIAQK
jgi:hypothetical protein